jgi:hypothetical protein
MVDHCFYTLIAYCNCLASRGYPAAVANDRLRHVYNPIGMIEKLAPSFRTAGVRNSSPRALKRSVIAVASFTITPDGVLVGVERKSC